MAEVLLKAENVSEVFGGLKAVSDFNFYINKGELVGLIGPNGAGKTTAFNMITGVYEPTTGTIDFDGKSIVGLKPYQITQRGIARTFQNIRLSQQMTVLENIMVGCHVRRRCPWWMAPRISACFFCAAKSESTGSSTVPSAVARMPCGPSTRSSSV